MPIRAIREADRPEWLRMLLALYPSTGPEDHTGSIDALFGRISHEELIPAEVFVCERAAGGLAGFLELSVRNYAEGCEGAVPSWRAGTSTRTHADAVSALP